MKVLKVSFDGAILQRGFWLYAWRITHKKREVFYVGRTGDSSSRYAASPFSRLSQHLDVRPNATANMLLRHVRKLSFEPLECKYDLVAFGPLFAEQDNLEDHRKYRDRIAPLEAALAALLRDANYEVIGQHGTSGYPDPKLLAEIRRAFHKVFD